MHRKTSQDKLVVRSRRMMIYTFLLILVFTYIGARGQVRKLKAQNGAVIEETAESPEEQLTEQPKDPDAGEQTGFFAWVKGLTDGTEEVGEKTKLREKAKLGEKTEEKTELGENLEPDKKNNLIVKMKMTV